MPELSMFASRAGLPVSPAPVPVLPQSPAPLAPLVRRRSVVSVNSPSPAVAKKSSPSSSSVAAALPPLPRLPRARKPRQPKPCECGCAGLTKGGRFLPGHDARLAAWVLRVKRGTIKLTDVPAPHKAAVAAVITPRKRQQRDK